MGNYLKWFFAFITEILQGFGLIFSGLFNGIIQIFNIKKYIDIFKEYSPHFGVPEWILAILSVLIVACCKKVYTFPSFYRKQRGSS